MDFVCEVISWENLFRNFNRKPDKKGKKDIYGKKKKIFEVNPISKRIKKIYTYNLELLYPDAL